MDSAKPIKLLLAALGGEGGHVLAAWLNDAAIASGHYAQGTFIPGVAQRTGATTYYLEIVPGAATRHRAGDARPVLALNAAPGEVDIMIASEMLEATRAILAGFVTPERTTLIASTARVFTVDEKSAMTDGRLDGERMRQLAADTARRLILADFAAVAARSKSFVNAVLLGALAAAEVLPIALEAYRGAIRRHGVAVDRNLAGFAAGLAAVADHARAPEPAPATPPLPPTDDAAGDVSEFPAEARSVLAAAVARLTDYQDAAYARRYLERVRRFVGHDGADARFIAELARQLALRMSVEDVIRVAQLKLRAARFERLRDEAGARGGDIIDVTEYMKPGAEEVLGLLPATIGRWLLPRVRADRGWAMRVRSTRPLGFLRLRALAAFRRWRPRTLKYADEDAWVERWLRLVERTLAVDPQAAREVVATAELIKGYAETYKRGQANWARIAARVIEPALVGRLAGVVFADAVLQSRLAAVRDPDGETLAQTIAAIEARAAAGKIAAE
ncbi:MAG TPA: indolepyruvate oxidoreductase subunit beta family protein [Hyphomicrobiaceae bacterium]|nr:indolepyruvate oxidoreductase subunit beta family protein [Hyphomicrobiaceae bacterium]